MSTPSRLFYEHLPPLGEAFQDKARVWSSLFALCGLSARERS